MADNEAVFKLPNGWVDDPETKCYTNLETGDIFCYSEELFCFIDKAPNQTVSKDCHTKLDMGDKFSAKEKPFDFVDNALVAMETVSKQCHTKLEMGDKFYAKEKPCDFVDNALAVMETVSKQASSQKVLPLRLYCGNGPRIHRQLCIETGIVDKRCKICGRVGQLTCFSPTFRKWALRRVTEEEFNQICSRCNERGHNCLSCDIPVTYRWAHRVERARKTVQCSLCGEMGHNRRSCIRGL